MLKTWQFCLLSLIFFCQCHGTDSSNFETSLPAQQNPYGNIGKKDSIRKITAPQQEAAKGPIINITDTVIEKSILLTLKDSAATLEILNVKLKRIFDTLLPEIVQSNGLKVTGNPVAFYKNQGTPYFFEAALPVNKRAKLKPTKAFYKTILSGPAVVAHFYGPKDLLVIGYGSLDDYLKNQKLKAAGASYEVYFKPVPSGKKKKITPYSTLTDIIIPVK